MDVSMLGRSFSIKMTYVWKIEGVAKGHWAVWPWPLWMLTFDLLYLQEFACNGTVVEHPEYGEVIQLQGDQRNNISGFLIKCKLAKESMIKVRVKSHALIYCIRNFPFWIYTKVKSHVFIAYRQVISQYTRHWDCKIIICRSMFWWVAQHRP